MAEPQPRPGDPSPMKNVVAGSGCGCGCMGGLVVLLGAVFLLAIPLAMVSPSAEGSFMVGGIASIVTGLLIAVLGLGMYFGSWFLE